MKIGSPLLAVLAASALAIASSCTPAPAGTGGKDSSVTDTSGSGIDAITGLPDAQVGPPDSPIAVPDAAITTPDAAITTPDVTTTTPDAGGGDVPSTDGAGPATDATVATPDAPAFTDATTPAPDLGTDTRDGGTTLTDLGSADLPLLGTKETIIQEDTLGFSAIDGKVLPREGTTTVTGFSGAGFADSDPGLAKGISWSVKSTRTGIAKITWRYAFGGAATNLRDGRLTVNGVVVADLVVFPYTTTWNDWAELPAIDIPLGAGSNFVRLEAVTASGLGNIDWVKFIGDGITPDNPSYTLGVTPNNPDWGSVTVSPVQTSYPVGASITLTATAKAGYFFQSWSGDTSSALATYTFQIARNTIVQGLFLPTGTTQAPGLIGYASVQDDKGTPYLITGGSMGPTVTATTIDQIKTNLGDDVPRVVQISGTFDGSAVLTNVVHIGSNKTLLGTGNNTHFIGYELNIAGARNIIIRNVAVSHVVAEGAGEANDAVVIGDRAKNIWIDHCDFYSDMNNGKDYYDGLLEIKNEASFITISWSLFHDHYKASLISSGDEQVGDKAVRVTYHHNYFYNTNSRLPSIRFGKAHIFNNYYKDNGSAVNSRMGAVVRVDNNYFQNTMPTITSEDSPEVGTWDVSNNVFNACTGPTTSNGSLTPPYPYTPDAPAGLPTSVPAGAGLGKI